MILLINMPKNSSMKRIRFSIVCLTGLFLMGLLAAQSSSPLHVGIEDIRLDNIRSPEDGSLQGFMLYVRQKDGMESVLLTETTRSADGMATNYAYRALEWNPVNGDEKRMLNGQPLVSQYARFSIIDSTAESHPELGTAFCLFIPLEMEYGYPWSRSGRTKVDIGTFINIRAFGAAYGDYSNGYEDNPFMFDLGTVPMDPPAPTALTDSYNPQAVTAFDLIAREAGGTITYSKGPETIVDDIINVLEELDPNRPAEIVFVLDSTGSMKDDVARLRESLIPRLEEALAGFDSMQLGLLLYRDYVDGYSFRGVPVRLYPFVDSVKGFKEHLFDFIIKGNEGGDVPEAVYEALYAAMDFYSWSEESQRKVVLIGDAEPHSKPRGSKKYTRELVVSTALEGNFTIDTIITPDGKTAADRK